MLAIVILLCISKENHCALLVCMFLPMIMFSRHKPANASNRTTSAERKPVGLIFFCSISLSSEPRMPSSDRFLLVAIRHQISGLLFVFLQCCLQQTFVYFFEELVQASTTWLFVRWKTLLLSTLLDQQPCYGYSIYFLNNINSRDLRNWNNVRVAFGHFLIIYELCC